MTSERFSRGNRRRVVVTGIGLITPVGSDLTTFWNNVSQGRSAAAPITKFDTSKLPVHIGAEVKNFSISQYAAIRDSRLDRTVQFGVAAATLALRDSGVASGHLPETRTGIVEGTTISGAESILKSQQKFLERSDYKRLHPYNIVSGYCGEGSSAISQYLGLKGAAITYCSGCASGNDAIGHAMQLIKSDQFDLMVAGGSEEMQEMLYLGFCRLRSMPENESDPLRAMRPFDRNRDGFLLGEGSAYLVLEELGHALSRGARIYAEVLGHGRTSEAYHPTDPEPTGIGYREALQRVLRDAEILPEEVDYVNAHGSATPKNDPIETLAIKAIFGSHAKHISVSSTKPITGHLMGASGAVETAITALSIANQCIPPTLNLSEPDAGCDLDYVTSSRPYPVRTALNLNAGFGGRYACLALRQYSSRNG